MREKKSTGSSNHLVANAKPIIERAFPARLIRMTGRRPTRSDRRPRMGVAMSCVPAKHPKSKPTVSAEPPMAST